MPDILIGSLKAAEANGDAQQTLASPHVTRGNGGLPQLQGLGGVDQHPDWLLNAGLQQVLQCVIIFVLENMRKLRKLSVSR